MEKQKNIPSLRFPEYTDKWSKTRLGDLSSLITKGTTPKKFVPEGIKFIKIECFDGDKINSNKCLFIDEVTHNKELKRSILKEGDILFAIAGATIGKVNVVSVDILPANTNQALSIVRLKNDVSRDFVYHNLKSNNMQRYILDNISVGAQPNLNLEQMNNFSFYISCINEQTKIASFLTKVDEKLTALKKKKELLEQYKRGVMQQIFSQELRFKDDNGNDYPDWVTNTLGEIAEIKKGKQLNKEELTQEGEYLCINGGISPSGYTDKFNTLENTITISEGGNSCGYVNFFTCKFWSGGHNYSLEIKNNEINNNDFIFQVLKQNQSEIMKLRVGSGLPNIQKKDLSAFELVVPNDIEEQSKIADFLSTIDIKISYCQSQIEKAEVWKKGLLQQMFC